LIINEIFDINSLLSLSDERPIIPTAEWAAISTISPTPGPIGRDESLRPSPGNQLIDLEDNGAFLAFCNRVVIKSYVILHGAYYFMLL
jgi:hypothetical protein